MIKTAVRADGAVPLGEDAARLGFRPGALILALDDEPATVEAPFQLLPRRAQRELPAGRRVG